MNPLYQIGAITTQTTTTVAASGNVRLHTVNFPKATSGTVTFEDISGSPVVYFTFPIGSIGCMILDGSCPNGLKIVTSAADTCVFAYQVP